jgi:hypothetical protein
MGKTRSMLDDVARKFIEAQHVFFVASAPLDAAGHVNLSPKGLDTFRILGPTTVAYIDFNGSGVETIAPERKRQNRADVLRVPGPPNIFRLYGHGRVVEPHEAEFAALVEPFPDRENARSIIVVELTRVTDSCGYGIPLFKYKGEREQLHAWARHRGPEGLKAYRQEKNRQSVDGLPGVAE